MTHNVWFQLYLSDSVNHNCYISIPGSYQGTYYDAELSYDGIDTYNAKIVLNDGTVLTSNFTSTAYLNSFQTYIGQKFKDSSSIDLKQFSITVDGVEVFSGNKTGIDTIKPDDYTVVGAPTITDDGVVSGFSLSNYLTSSEIDVTEKSFSINLGKIKVKDTSNTQILFGGNTAGKLFSIAISAAQKKFYISSNSTNFNTVFTDDITLHVGDEYYLIGGVENNEAYLKYSVDGNNWIEIRTSITTPYTDLQIYIGAGILNNDSMSYFREGSIDLNAFKIYVDGNLVYQPCLKIPYTQTKDGKKIVDSQYRFRVEDEYTQAGFTPYYTLDTESRGNYTVVGSPTIGSNFVASSQSIPPGVIVKQGSAIEVTFVRKKVEVESD